MKLYFQGRYFDSIHNCPVLTWNRVTTTGDLREIHRGGRYNEKAARKNWIAIYDEYIKEFGIPEEYKRYLRDMAWACADYAEAYNGKKWKLPIAQMREAQAKAAFGEAPAAKFSEVVARVSRAVGFAIDPSRVTVAQFFGYVKSLKE